MDRSLEATVHWGHNESDTTSEAAYHHGYRTRIAKKDRIYDKGMSERNLCRWRKQQYEFEIIELPGLSGAGFSVM